MRYIVIDDDGVPIRKFWTRKDAEDFALQNYRILVLPKPAKPTPNDMFAQLGEARW